MRLKAIAWIILAATSIAAADAQSVQAPQVRYYSRQHLEGMFVKATARQAVTHPDWSCVPGKLDGFNAAFYAYMNPDVVEYYGTTEDGLLSHYVTYGRGEGRAACQAGGGTTFQPTDVFLRTAPRNGTSNYVATAGQDTYDMPAQFAINTVVTVDGFDVVKDRIGYGSVEAWAGAPTFTDLGGGKGTEIDWGGKVHLTLVGIQMADARRIVGAN